MWMDAHNVAGIISLPFHLVMALTASVFAFHDGIYAVQNKLFHNGEVAAMLETARTVPERSPALRDPAAMLPQDSLVAVAERLAPDFEPTRLQYMDITGPRTHVRVWGRNDMALAARGGGGFVAIDPYTGGIISSENIPGFQDAPNTLVSSFFALHVAGYSGIVVQWLYFLLGLAGAWLFYNGNLLWIETRRRKSSPSNRGLPLQRRDVRVMAALTVRICLGSMCGISLTIVAAKWLHGHVTDLDSWHRILYYAVFFGCIAWAFFRGAAGAAVQLLWLASAFTFAIPLQRFLLGFFPRLGCGRIRVRQRLALM